MRPHPYIIKTHSHPGYVVQSHVEFAYSAADAITQLCLRKRLDRSHLVDIRPPRTDADRELVRVMQLALPD
jgi:hypothetical protein